MKQELGGVRVRNVTEATSHLLIASVLRAYRTLPGGCQDL